MDLAKELIDCAFNDGGFQMPPNRQIISIIIDSKDGISGWVSTADRTDMQLALSSLLSGITH